MLEKVLMILGTALIVAIWWELRGINKQLDESLEED